jgi:hemoglobin-like flavoprotein
MAGIPERDLELFNDSLERCTRGPRFLERFYELFMASSPEVAAKFVDTDFRRQRRVLKISLYMMMLAAEGKLEADLHLERIARRHSRAELRIRPELYDLWLECLLRAARESDPQFGAETEAAWRVILRRGIEFMKARY